VVYTYGFTKVLATEGLLAKVKFLVGSGMTQKKGSLSDVQYFVFIAHEMWQLAHHCFLLKYF